MPYSKTDSSRSGLSAFSTQSARCVTGVFIELFETASKRTHRGGFLAAKSAAFLLEPPPPTSSVDSQINRVRLICCGMQKLLIAFRIVIRGARLMVRNVSPIQRESASSERGTVIAWRHANCLCSRIFPSKNSVARDRILSSDKRITRWSALT